MPTEVTDVLIKQMEDLKEDLKGLREQMTKDHAALSEKVSALSDRVLKLEHHERVVRWVFAVGGTAGGFLMREVLGRLLNAA